jgi:hypothetical protein
MLGFLTRKCTSFVINNLGVSLAGRLLFLNRILVHTILNENIYFRLKLVF